MKLKWQNDGTIKTPAARARGLGAAHEGVTHWWHARVTAVAATPLMLWLVWSVIHMQGWAHADFTLWLAQPVNAVLMVLSVITVFYHAALGAQVIIEDYVHHEGFKIAKLIGMQLFFLTAAVACVFSIFKIALAG